jgi:hypothetical protein
VTSFNWSESSLRHARSRLSPLADPSLRQRELSSLALTLTQESYLSYSYSLYSLSFLPFHPFHEPSSLSRLTLTSHVLSSLSLHSPLRSLFTLRTPAFQTPPLSYIFSILSLIHFTGAVTTRPLATTPRTPLHFLSRTTRVCTLFSCALTFILLSITIHTETYAHTYLCVEVSFLLFFRSLGSLLLPRAVSLRKFNRGIFRVSL